MYLEVAYMVYLIGSVFMTWWVASTLSVNGKVFLIESFQSEVLAKSVNHMLVVGFYLVNLGYVFLALKTNAHIVNVRELIEFLSKKFGLVLVVLGGLHFLNLYVIARWRRAQPALVGDGASR